MSNVFGIPADADAVTLNVTVTNTTAPSFLTIYPNGDTRPLASNLNWSAGGTIANAVTVKVGTGGKIRVYNPTGQVDVIIDAVGYYRTAGGAGFTSLAPVRIQDSRPSGPKSTPRRGRRGRIAIHVAGEGGVPADAEAVVVNTTVTNTTPGRRSSPSTRTDRPASGVQHQLVPGPDHRQRRDGQGGRQHPGVQPDRQRPT
ncbi:MAG: hypothetical protein R2690_16505 [Acidimicrobiales bacterium]